MSLHHDPGDAPNAGFASGLRLSPSRLLSLLTGVTAVVTLGAIFFSTPVIPIASSNAEARPTEVDWSRIAPLDRPRAEMDHAVRLEQEGKFDEASAWFTRARNSAVSVRNFSLAAQSYRRQGTMLIKQDPTGNFDEATRLVNEAIRLDEEHDLEKNLARDKVALAGILLKRKQPRDYQQAIDLYQDVLHSAGQDDQIESEAVVAAEVGLGYLLREHRGDVEGARAAYQRALAFYQAEEDIGRQADTLYRIGIRSLDLEDWKAADAQLEESSTLWKQVRVAEWNLSSPMALGDRSELMRIVGKVLRLEQRFDRAIREGRPSADTAFEAEVTAAERALEALQDSPLLKDEKRHTSQIWLYRFADAELERFRGGDVEASLKPLAASSGEEGFVAGSALAFYYVTTRRPESGLGLTVDLLKQFNPAHCSIPVLRTRFDDLVHLMSRFRPQQAVDDIAAICRRG